MSFTIIQNEHANGLDCIEITQVAGLNTRDHDLSMAPDQFNRLMNVLAVGNRLEKRPGIDTYGAAQTGDRVCGLGFFESDSGVTPLMTVNQTLYKYVSSAWAASDKTNYTADLDTVMLQFNSKSGNSVVTGTSSAGSTIYQVEDSSKTWTPGQYAGYCVVIEGEIKFIADNTATVLKLGEKCNSDIDTAYQTKSYAIYALAPHAIIMNGTDSVQKYDLTTTTPLDGSHVTSGKALPTSKVGCVHQGRIWYAKGKGNDNDRVFLSDSGVAENITTDTNININLQFLNDGDNVVNLGSMPVDKGSACVVAKTQSVHVIEGENILNYTSRPLLSRKGCIAQKSFATTKGTVFMLGDSGDVVSIADTGEGPLSDPLPISRTIKDEIAAQSAAEQADACGIVWENKYFLRVGTKIWYYDIEQSLAQNKHVWYDLEYYLGDLQFSMFAIINKLLYAGADLTGQAYNLFSGNDDDSQWVEMVIDSGEISLPGRPHLWIERIEIMGEKDDVTVLGLQFLTDGGSFGSVQSATLSRADCRYVFPIRTRCKSFRYRISERSTNAATGIPLPIRIFFRRSDSGEDGTKG